MAVNRLDDIAARNKRALRDTKRKVAWVTVIVLALVAVAIALSAGLGVPKTPPHQVVPADDPTHVRGVPMR